METTISENLQKGIEAHKSGNLQEADKYYTAILQAQPNHPDANHNMGVLAVSVGKVQQALPFFKKALEVNSTIAQFWLSLIESLIKLRRYQDARNILSQAQAKGIKGDAFDQVSMKLEKRIATNPMEASLKDLISLYQEGDFQRVVANSKKFLEEFPNSHQITNILGGALANLDKFDEAIRCYKRALKIRPNFAEAFFNIGVLRQKQFKPNEALKNFKKAIDLNSSYAEAYNAIGVLSKNMGNLDEAVGNYKKAINVNNDYPDPHFNLGVINYEHASFDQAIKHYKNALRIQPNYPNALLGLAKVHQSEFNLKEAEKCFKKLLQIRPDYVDGYMGLADLFKCDGKLEKAVENYKFALKLSPNYAEAYNNLGNIFNDIGKPKEAIKFYKKAISIKPAYSDAYKNYSSIADYAEDTESFLKLKQLYENSNLDDRDRCQVCFALARAYESFEQNETNFKFLLEANHLRKTSLAYTIEADEALFEKILKTQKKLAEISLEPDADLQKITPIFIVGMPRSGTTLVEQIITSHSKIHAAGELQYVPYYGGKLSRGEVEISTESISLFRSTYISKIKEKANGMNFVTDKLPQNFLFIPLICRAFPSAKIIHVHRNPAATCWSNFKTYFEDDRIGFCYDLSDIKLYYTMYARLMLNFCKIYRNRIYNLNYEKLVTNPNAETILLINQIGLSWEDSCLRPQNNMRPVHTASRSQVRKAIYTGSSIEWKKYEKFLAVAFRDLPVFE